MLLHPFAFAKFCLRPAGLAPQSSGQALAQANRGAGLECFSRNAGALVPAASSGKASVNAVNKETEWVSRRNGSREV